MESACARPIVGETELMLYDGTFDWDDYCAHVDVVANVNGWNSNTKGHRASCALRGVALSVFSSLDSENRTEWNTLSTALSKRFGQKHLAMKWQIELESRYQRPQESTSDLAYDIERLCRFAFPDLPRNCKDQIGVRIFLRALSNDQLRRLLAVSVPSSIQDALHQALVIEATLGHSDLVEQADSTGDSSCSSITKYQHAVCSSRTTGSALFVQLQLNATPCYLLIDTGATVSVVRPDVARKSGAEISTAHHAMLRTVHGELIEALGSARINVRLGERHIMHSFVVAEIFDEAILGLDLLNILGACLDLRSHRMLINSDIFPLLSFGTCPQVKNIECASDFEWIQRALDSSELINGSEEYKKVFSLFQKHARVFAASGKPLGRTHVVKHAIETGDARPIKQAPRRVPYAQEAQIDKLMQEMIEQDVIEPSKSPWASPVVLIPKKDGSIRFCVDYRKVNQVTKKDSYTLPCVQELLDTLGGAQWFCTIDLKCGYWQIGLSEESKEKTAFSLYRKGLWQFKVMPFGLTNAPATFQRLMEVVIPSELALTYLDDVIIYGNDFGTVFEKLEKVLECFSKANLQINPKKCAFFRRETAYLGHVISKQGVQTDPVKTKAVLEWPVPKSKKNVRAFLGFCSYYRRFVKGFADIAKPLTRLTEGNAQFIWDRACNTSFIELKKAMTTAPVLAFPDFSLPFVLDCDASAHTVGAVLSQRQSDQEVAIAYFSSTLSRPEQNYCATRRELLAVVRSISHFHQYLFGRHFTLRTDHAALTWLTNFKRPEGQLARWLETLQQYDFTIKHRAGSKHANADGLSRRPCEVGCGYCCRREKEDTLKIAAISLQSEASVDEQMLDPSIQKVINHKVNGVKPSLSDLTAADNRVRQLVNRWESLEVHNNQLYHRWDGPTNRLQWVVPLSRMKSVLETCHDNPVGGHFGSFKGPKKKITAPLQQVALGSPFDRIGMDILGPFPKTRRGNRYILVAADYFTKWPEAIAIPDQEAKTVAIALIENVLSRVGIPLEIHTDQGRNFESTLVRELAQLMGIVKTRSTSLHPQSGGLVERLNRTLTKHLAQFVDRSQSNWDEKLPLFLLAYRSACHSTTGLSPAQLVYGRDLRLPEILVRPPVQEVRPTTEYVIQLREHLQQVRDFAAKEAGVKMRSQKESFDRHARTPTLKEGDWVWFYNPQRRPGRNPKLQPAWTGPWVIKQKRNDVLYKIKLGRTTRLIHVNRLVKADIATPEDRLRGREELCRETT
ncbi:multicellular organismal development [Nesidiocoris tenuis]|uniref:RNA-directed DNA polymerase n=1 Tax=Nesidiocoris tenuis TaxID=355587 RepID=A0ABN7AIT7_9HEMI|nr:multicellular organismal development [Nesidiocoris tenuis]